MKKAIRAALAVVAGAGALTAVSVVLPSNDPVGVGQVTTSETRTPGGDSRYFPSVGTVPVETPSARTTPNSVAKPSESPKPKSSVRASERPESAERAQTRKRTVSAPKTSPSAVRATPRKTASKQTETVTTIGSYVDCSGYAQSCIDQGKLTKYNPGQVTLAGHNYMGYQWMSRLPVGRKVVITSGSLAGTYRVYGHAWSERARKGGKFPAAGYSASLVLQTCEPNGTGYSLLRRV